MRTATATQPPLTTTQPRCTLTIISEKDERKRDRYGYAIHRPDGRHIQTCTGFFARADAVKAGNQQLEMFNNDLNAGRAN